MSGNAPVWSISAGREAQSKPARGCLGRLMIARGPARPPAEAPLELPYRLKTGLLPAGELAYCRAMNTGMVEATTYVFRTWFSGMVDV